jgi:hypothetical protein
MLGESLQRFAIVLIGTAVFFQLESAPTGFAALIMFAAVLVGLVGIIIDAVDRPLFTDDPRPYAD